MWKPSSCLVFLEAAVPAAYVMVVPKEEWLPVPYCDGMYHLDKDGRRRKLIHKKPDNLTFAPTYTTNATETGGLPCSVIHPLKFSQERSVDYWRRVVEAECSNCRTEIKGNLWSSVVDDLEG